MRIIKFFTSKRVWLNLIAMAVLTILLVFGAMKYLNVYTRHGETIEIPDFRGLKLEELEKYTAEDYFEFVVIDSVYDSDQEKGSVVDQAPLPNSTVKKGRKVYLTIVAMQPKTIEMPDLTDLTLRQAKEILKSYGLEIASLEYVPNLAKNAVLKQEYLGQKIAPGERIEKGSAIKLVLGRGAHKEKVDVPFLIGMKKSKAINLIYGNSLNIGKERYYNPSDTTGVRVYKQYPKPFKNRNLSLGDSIDLVYRNNRNFDFQSYIEKYKKDSLFLKESNTKKKKRSKN